MRSQVVWAWVRACGLVLLLAGRIFPPVAGADLHVIASVVVAPLIVVEVVRWLPRVHPAWVFVFCVFAPLALSGAVRGDIFTTYGTEKFVDLVSSTLLSAAAVTLLRDRRDVERFARAWVVAGIILAAFTLTNASADSRVTAFGDQNPIWLARAIGTTSIALAWLGFVRKVPNWLALPGVAFLVAGVLVTGSRGPALGTLLGLVVVTLLTGKGARRVVVTVLAAVTALIMPLIPAVMELRVFSLMATLGESSSDVTRTEMWGRTIALIWETPGGVGYGNWAREAPSPTHHEYPHNLFLEVMAETGWITALVLIGSVVLVLVRLVRSRADPVAILVLGMLLAETLAVSVSGDVNARTFFAMLTLGYVTSRFARDRDVVGRSFSGAFAASRSSGASPNVRTRGELGHG